MSLDELWLSSQQWLSNLSSKAHTGIQAGSYKSFDLQSLSCNWLSLPLAIRIAVVVVIVLSLVPVVTSLYTRHRYRRALDSLLSRSATSSKGLTIEPPPIPYSIPFLGSAAAFLEPRPGAFWSYLFSFHPRNAGSCTLRLGPRTAHIIHDPLAVQTLFKSKDANRLEFNIQIARTSLGVPGQDLMKYHGTNKKDVPIYEGPPEQNPLHIAEKINLDTLLKTDAVNELTSEFSKQFRKRVDMLENGQELDLLNWLRGDMFDASGRALLGEKVFEYYPEFRTEFWDFEANMLSLFFGLPEFMVPTAVRARDAGVKGLMKWHNGMAKEGLVDIVSSEGPVSWEPHYGSRANRARQEMYNKFKLSTKARAGFDLGFTFGLASNAIPATAWMLLHILDPGADKTILPRVMTELKSAQLQDGSLNLPILFALPLMQSIFHEVLRLYTDVLVSRTLEKDHVLPVSNLDSKILLKKDTLAFAPAWPGQRDPGVWDGVKPAEVFYHERFLTTDPDTGKDVFTTSGTAGRFFPFGGGKSVCPGRVFARQEIFAATAMLLLAFDFEIVSFLDGKGKNCDKFPGLRDGLGGSGIVMPAGDVRLRARARKF